MNLNGLKIEVIQLIIKTQNADLLEYLKAILDNDINPSNWEDLPEEARTRIKQAMKSADEGKLKPHKEVMIELRQKLLDGPL